MNDPGSHRYSTLRAEARKAEALHGVLVVVDNRLLHARSIEPRRTRTSLQGVSSRAQEPPACAGPCLIELGGRIQVGFAQIEAHESRRGICVVRHMLPWWEPCAVELDWLNSMLESKDK